jgi:hypothetical protein
VHTELASALSPVLHDLGTEQDLTAQLRDEQWAGTPGQMSARLGNPADGSTMGIYVLAADSDAQRIASLADQVQEWAVETLWKAGLSATWPECPLHPGSHPKSRYGDAQNSASR